MAWAGKSQEFHAKIAYWKRSEGLALYAALAGWRISISGAILEECWTWRAGLPLLPTCNLFLCFPLLLQLVEPCILLFLILLQVHFLYKGTLRVLLVLLHDYPEFLCDYHFSFCDVIPRSCIQIRNIILSAFPRNMRLPDPSTPNLKVSHWA